MPPVGIRIGRGRTCPSGAGAVWPVWRAVTVFTIGTSFIIRYIKLCSQPILVSAETCQEGEGGCNIHCQQLEPERKQTKLISCLVLLHHYCLPARCPTVFLALLRTIVILTTTLSLQLLQSLYSLHPFDTSCSSLQVHYCYLCCIPASF